MILPSRATDARPGNALTADEYRAQSEVARDENKTKAPPWGDCTAKFNCPCPTCQRTRAVYQAERPAIRGSDNPSR